MNVDEIPLSLALGPVNWLDAFSTHPELRASLSCTHSTDRTGLQRGADTSRRVHSPITLLHFTSNDCVNDTRHRTR